MEATLHALMLDTARHVIAHQRAAFDLQVKNQTAEGISLRFWRMGYAWHRDVLPCSVPQRRIDRDYSFDRAQMRAAGAGRLTHVLRDGRLVQVQGAPVNEEVVSAARRKHKEELRPGPLR